MQRYVVNDDIFPLLGINIDKVVLSGGGHDLAYFPANRRVFYDGQEVTRDDQLFWELVTDVLTTIDNRMQSPAVRRQLEPFRKYFSIPETLVEDPGFVVPEFPLRLKTAGILRSFYRNPILLIDRTYHYGGPKGPRGGDACVHIRKDMKTFTRGTQANQPAEKRHEVVVTNPTELALRIEDKSYPVYRKMIDYLALTYGFDF